MLVIPETFRSIAVYAVVKHLPETLIILPEPDDLETVSVPVSPVRLFLTNWNVVFELKDWKSLYEVSEEVSVATVLPFILITTGSSLVAALVQFADNDINAEPFMVNPIIKELASL